MNILCYNVEKGLVEAIALKFLPKGFKLTTANNAFELKKAVFSGNIELIIADITADKTKEDIDVEFLKWIHFVDQKNDFKKVILSKITDEYSIRKLMELGIQLFISKKNSTSVIIEKLEQIIDKLDSKIPESRKHVRVTPDDSENPLVVFYVGDTKITGKIANISMGGVLIQVDDAAKIVGVTQDHEVSRIQLSLNNRKIIVNAIVVMKKQNLLALQYSSISETYKEVLSKYIFAKISKTE